MNIEKTLKRLRRLLEADDFCLTDRVYEGTKRLFFSCSGDPGLHAELMAHTGEYLRDEFLLNTDGTGAAFEPPESVQEDYRKVCNLRPGFTRWFREVSGEAGGMTVGRWLAHMLGFRHRSVHLFLEHPVLENSIFVQFRSFDKYHSPGCVDLVLGGHVQGGASMRESLQEELDEELGLDLERDVTELEEIGAYDYRVPVHHVDYRDVEYATVYRGRLVAGAMERIRFPDREVAGVALFRLTELVILLRDFPERAASGIHGSFPLYLEHRG